MIYEEEKEDVYVSHVGLFFTKKRSDFNARLCQTLGQGDALPVIFAISKEVAESGIARNRVNIEKEHVLR